MQEASWWAAVPALTMLATLIFCIGGGRAAGQTSEGMLDDAGQAGGVLTAEPGDAGTPKAASRPPTGDIPRPGVMGTHSMLNSAMSSGVGGPVQLGPTVSLDPSIAGGPPGGMVRAASSAIEPVHEIPLSGQVLVTSGSGSSAVVPASRQMAMSASGSTAFASGIQLSGMQSASIGGPALLSTGSGLMSLPEELVASGAGHGIAAGGRVIPLASPGSIHFKSSSGSGVQLSSSTGSRLKPSTSAGSKAGSGTPGTVSRVSGGGSGLTLGVATGGGSSTTTMSPIMAARTDEQFNA